MRGDRDASEIMAAMLLPLAASVSTVILAIIAIASVVLLVLIIVAPWKQIRDEPPLDKDAEARVLLHRPNPEEATGELPAIRDVDPAERTGGDTDENADYSELRDLDD
jgi:hypothetical protein